MTTPGWMPPGIANSYTLDMSIREVIDLIQTGALDLNQPFQRGSVWGQVQKSEFIESLLTGLPTPPIYLSEEPHGRLIVIDGKQRLLAIAGFARSEFPLSHTELSPELEGLYFSDLHESVRRRFMSRPLVRCIVLREPSDQWVKHVLFERLNTGGRTLSRQELRNARYSGPLNDVLNELGAEPFLVQQLGSSQLLRDMTNVEYVLRFTALSQKGVVLEKQLTAYLDRFLESHRDAPPSEVQGYKARFRRALRACEAILGEHAFRRFDNKIGWRHQFSLPVYDAEMLGFSQASHHALDSAIENAEVVKGAISSILDGEMFSAGANVNRISSIRARASAVRELLEASAGKASS
ncbi:DUF262 domain-containing protein [Micromonospora chersina]